MLTGTTNSMDLIAVGSDSSGFLAAAHLQTANTVRGHLSEDTVALYNLSRFASVTNGSFVVDGKTISVSTADSIQSIVSRINASGARVTAAFNATTNKLELATTYNTEDLVAIGSDTSGFLARAGVSSANTVRGNIRDDQQVLAKTTQFASVASGSFSINGMTISVNKDTDTLASLVTRINAASAGVTAAYDATLDKLVLTGTTNSMDLIAVGSDSSGFLAAAHLQTANTLRGHLSEDTVALYNLSRFASVTNGSFVVDGKTIGVSTADSVQSIVSRINASGARVTAAFNATTNKLELATTYNTEDLVAIGSDTSGFLASAGVSSANTVRGNLRDDQQVLAKTTQFASVASGSFSINGLTISVNKDTDTLASLVTRINAAAAGVTAAYDATLDKLVLTGTTNSMDLIDVGSDSSGFLAAATCRPPTPSAATSPRTPSPSTTSSRFSSVTNGSFVVDGKTISVSTADSLQSIVRAINASGARVTAAFNATTNKLELDDDLQHRGPGRHRQRHLGLPRRRRRQQRQHRPRQHPRRPAGAGQDDPVRQRRLGLVQHQRRGHLGQQGHRHPRHHRHPHQRRRRRRHRRLRLHARQARAHRHQQQHGPHRRRQRLHRLSLRRTPADQQHRSRPPLRRHRRPLQPRRASPPSPTAPSSSTARPSAWTSPTDSVQSI